jgi:hypothetical protein
MTDPLTPPWEMCKTCGGDHWTKDHLLQQIPQIKWEIIRGAVFEQFKVDLNARLSPLESLLQEAVLMINVKGPLSRHFDHGRIKIVGPWRLPEGIKWQAIADPYNASWEVSNQPIEGLGSTVEEALQELIRKFHEQEAKAK